MIPVLLSIQTVTTLCPHCGAPSATRLQHTRTPTFTEWCDRCGYWHTDGQAPVQHQAVLTWRHRTSLTPTVQYVPLEADLDASCSDLQARPSLSVITLRRAPHYRLDFLLGEPEAHLGSLPQPIQDQLRDLFAAFGEVPHAVLDGTLFLQSLDGTPGYRVFRIKEAPHGEWAVSAAGEATPFYLGREDDAWVDPNACLPDLVTYA